jgi:hypothetical protein
MTVFKAKQLKGKLIFSYEEDEWQYLCWTILSRCFEEHDMIGPCILKVYLEQPNKVVNFVTRGVLGIIIFRNSTQRHLNWL